MHKLLYVCLDGLGDDPIPEFDGRTPLEAADTPNLDALAARGRTGHGDHGGTGHRARVRHRRVRRSSATTPTRSIPAAACWRRSASAWTSATATSPTASTSPRPTGREIVDRRVGRDLSSEEAQALADEVNETLALPGATLRPAGDGRAPRRAGDPDRRRTALVGRGHEHRPRLPARRATSASRSRRSNPSSRTATALEDSDAARRAADLTNAFVEGSARILDASEVNARRRADGRLPAQPDPHPRRRRSPARRSSRSRNGSACRGGASSRCPSSGASRWCSGWTPSTPPASTPSDSAAAAEERYAAWARAGRGRPSTAIEALYVHIKGPDVPAHDGRAEDKRDVIAAIDRAFFGEVLPSLGPRHGRGRHRRPRHVVRAEGAHGRSRPASWSAAASISRTAPSPSANEPANDGSARHAARDPRSCPSSPPRSAAEHPERPKLRFPAS